jgi:hypothetical protein
MAITPLPAHLDGVDTRPTNYHHLSTNIIICKTKWKQPASPSKLLIPIKELIAKEVGLRLSQ